MKKSRWRIAAIIALGICAPAYAQNGEGTVVLGRALEDGPTLPTYSMHFSCSDSIPGSNCSVEVATDEAFAKQVPSPSQDGGPRTLWGLRKDATYYVRVRSWAFMNGSMRWGQYSPVVKYKYVTPPKVSYPPNTNELAPAQLGSYDCRGVKGTKLLPMAAMRPGDLIRSPNKTYELWYQPDGNLVVYQVSPQKKAIWASGTVVNNPYFVRMKTDGNLTVSHGESGPNGNPIEVQKWESKTAGHANASAVLQDDGNLVIYDEKENCKAWWASKSSK
jgi:hypothetical protein